MNLQTLQHSQNYRVNLEAFEGPLDLLLYLIKRDDLDIYDIPVSFILDEFMNYIDTLKELNIDYAGEFLLMTSELTHLKSKILLPTEQREEESEEGPDPRADLVRRLLEYQQYKEASFHLESRSQLQRDVFIPLSPELVKSEEEGPLEADVFQLVEAFGKLLSRVEQKNFHAVNVDRMSVSARIYQLMDLVKKDSTTSLQQLVEDISARHMIVVTFLALLEMCRLKVVKVYQVERCGELYLRGTMEEVSEEEMIHLIRAEDYLAYQGKIKPEAKEEK